jgi:4-amino-4-deoxychorismate lyase
MEELQRILIDGQPLSQPGHALSALDRGVHYGDGLFETIACEGGRPRLIERHLQRFAAGCERLGLAPGDGAALAREVRELAAGTPRAIVKLLLTRGVALARGYAPTGVERTVRIALRYAWPAPDAEQERLGVRVRCATLRLGENPALAGIKHCNRLEQVLARREWADPGIAEALMFSSSEALISGTMSNVFLVRGSRVLTPRIDRCGVSGVMRGLVLEIASAAGISAEERRLDAADLAAAEELFLTSALTGIRPVRELDGIGLAVGPVTRHLQAQLRAHLAAEARGGGHRD